MIKYNYFLNRNVYKLYRYSNHQKKEMVPKQKSKRKVTKKNPIKTKVHPEYPNWFVLVMFVLVIISSVIGIVLFSSGV